MLAMPRDPRDWMLYITLAVTGSYGVFALIRHVRLKIDSRRWDKLEPWQRMAKIKDEPRGFDVLPPKGKE